MAWSNEGRKLPSNWKAIREKVFKRDGYRCTQRNVYGERCEGAAEECDHIGKNWDHSMENLRSLCHWHHAKKTAQQSATSARIRRQKVSSKFRRREDHPGQL